MIGVELKYLIGSGYLRIFDGVCQAIQKLEAMDCQPIKILLRGTYRKSTNENASCRQTKCIIYRQWLSSDVLYFLVPTPPIVSKATNTSIMEHLIAIKISVLTLIFSLDNSGR